MASLIVCDRCTRTISYREGWALSITDGTRPSGEPPTRYDLCRDCMKAVAATEDWILM